MNATLQDLIIPVTLGAFGGKHRVTVEIRPPESKPFDIEIAYRMTDRVDMYCVRWSSHMNIIAGVPANPGIEMAVVRAAAVTKLMAEFRRRKIAWPGEITVPEEEKE